MQDNFSQNSHRIITQKFQNTKKTFEVAHEGQLDSTFFDLQSGDIVFFYGDLGAGKSTYVRHWLRKISKDESLVVRSPTYTYYSEYTFWNKKIYHFDLYRCWDLDTFLSIGGYEIIENPENICLIEWPEILEDEDIIPTCQISLSRPSTV